MANLTDPETLALAGVLRRRYHERYHQAVDAAQDVLEELERAGYHVVRAGVRELRPVVRAEAQR